MSAPTDQFSLSETPILDCWKNFAADVDVTNFLYPENRDQKDKCQCLILTASFLEKVIVWSSDSGPWAIDVLLGHQREALVHCASAVECTECTSNSELNLLLMIVAELTSSLCERIIRGYRELQSDYVHQHNWCFPPTPAYSIPRTTSQASSSADVNSGQAPQDAIRARMNMGSEEIWYATYKVATEGERFQVVHCLIKVQLKELVKLILILRRRAGTRTGQLLPLNRAAKTVQAAQNMFTSRRSSQA